MADFGTTFGEIVKVEMITIMKYIGCVRESGDGGGLSIKIINGV